MSADYYSISGATVSYFGSMRVDAPAVAITASHIPAQPYPALEGYIIARRRQIAAEVATALE